MSNSIGDGLGKIENAINVLASTADFRKGMEGALAQLAISTRCVLPDEAERTRSSILDSFDELDDFIKTLSEENYEEMAKQILELHAMLRD